MSSIDIAKYPSIDKKDITTADGKLNFLGTFIVISVCFVVLNLFFDNFVTDKENAN